MWWILRSVCSFTQSQRKDNKFFLELAITNVGRSSLSPSLSRGFMKGQALRMMKHFSIKDSCLVTVQWELWPNISCCVNWAQAGKAWIPSQHYLYRHCWNGLKTERNMTVTTLLCSANISPTYNRATGSLWVGQALWNERQSAGVSTGFT